MSIKGQKRRQEREKKSKQLAHRVVMGIMAVLLLLGILAAVMMSL